MASSWFLFFSYHNDARSNKHQITKMLFVLQRTEIWFQVSSIQSAVLCSVQTYERSSKLCYGARFQDSRLSACNVAFSFVLRVGIPDRGNLSWLNLGIRRYEIWFALSHILTRTHRGAQTVWWTKKYTWLPWARQQQITFWRENLNFVSDWL